MAEVKFPTEKISLPSRGKLYSETSPLRTGVVEIKYPTSKSEDILSNQEYIQKGTVIDKFLQDLIVDKTINYGDLLIGDKNALLVAARILGYGKCYTFSYRDHEEEVDLSQIQDKPLASEIEQATSNRFSFTLPVSQRVLEFKLLTRIKYMILSVDGEEDRKVIREFVDSELLAADSRALRKYVTDLQPDIDMVFYPEDSEEPVQIPILPSFLWPDLNY